MPAGAGAAVFAVMERLLHTPSEWIRWLVLLAECPDRAAELDARASMLAERLGPEDVLAAMERARGIERWLDGEDA